MQQEYKRHPLSALYPDLTPEEMLEMKDSMAVSGVLDPILLFEGMILDGWQRYSTAKLIGLECPTEEYGGTWEEADALVHGKHARRNLDKGQRAQVALRREALRQERMPGTRPKSLAEMAREEGISERTMAQARVVESKGVPALRVAAEDGVVSVKQAEKIAQLPRREQPQALKAAIEKTDEPRKAAPRRAAPGAGLPVQTPQVGVAQEEVDQLRHALADLAEDHDRMEARLAAHFMDATPEEKAAHQTLLESLQADLRTARAELNAVKASRNHYMEENNALKDQCARNDRELARYRDLARTAVTRRA